MNHHREDRSRAPAVIVRGRDHPELGKVVVSELSRSLAVATSAGAVWKDPPAVDPNEDVAAVVEGDRAALVVAADGHYGREASEIAVDLVLAELGDDPPPADLDDEALVSLFFRANLAVQRETTRPNSPHRESATTLALALVADRVAQWASLGDSAVFTVAEGSCTRVDTPRGAYLGNRFTPSEIAQLVSRGRVELPATACVVLATDGITDPLPDPELEVARAVAAATMRAATAGDLARGLVRIALESGVADAATTAVANTRGKA